MHPELNRLQSNYNQILDTYEAGLMNYDQAMAEISRASAVDAAGWKWSIDPTSGQFFRSAPGYDPEFADPANFVDQSQMPQAPGWPAQGQLSSGPGDFGPPSFSNDGFAPMGQPALGEPVTKGAKTGKSGRKQKGASGKEPRSASSKGGRGSFVRNVILIIALAAFAIVYVSSKHHPSSSSTGVPTSSASVSTTTVVPVTQPTVPVTQPTAPVTQPTVPVTRPTVPVTRPTVPVTHPTVPVTRPTVPVTRPTVPVTHPTVPVTRTTAPQSVAPSTPTGIRISVSGTSVTVAWNASNGYGFGVTYRVVARPGGASCSTSALSCTIKGLTSGQIYSFVVQASSLAGSSSWSAPSSQVFL